MFVCKCTSIYEVLENQISSDRQVYQTMLILIHHIFWQKAYHFEKLFLCVVYFDQRLGAAHAKHLLKLSFSVFLLQKNVKKQEICSNLAFALERWSTVLLPKK